LKGFGDTAHIREAALKSTAQFLSPAA